MAARGRGLLTEAERGVGCCVLTTEAVLSMLARELGSFAVTLKVTTIDSPGSNPNLSAATTRLGCAPCCRSGNPAEALSLEAAVLVLQVKRTLST